MLFLLESDYVNKLIRIEIHKFTDDLLLDLI